MQLKSSIIEYYIVLHRDLVDEYFVDQTHTNITVQKGEMETIKPPMFGNDMTFCEVITPEKLHLNFSSRPEVRPDKLRYLFHAKIYHCISLKNRPTFIFVDQIFFFWLKYGWR